MSLTSINSNQAKNQFADEDPIAAAAAVAQACASVDSGDDLHETLKDLDKILPGLPLQHYSPDGELNPQFYHDEPKGGAKNIFPKGSGSVPPIDPNINTGRPIVVIVEGRKQMIAAAAYAPDDVLLVGILDCWGWSFEGQAPASLDALVDGKDVIVIFNANVASTPNAYAAGKTLVETLEVIGATKVTFASTPGNGAVGLDDFLSRRRIEKRGEVFAKILAKSVPFTTITKPAKWREGVIPRAEGSDTKGAGEVEIARIFDTVASGPYFIAPKKFFYNGSQLGDGLILAGIETTVKINGVRTDCIALMSTIVDEITGLDYFALTLDAFLIRDSAGHRTRSVRIDNKFVRCLVITKAAWEGNARKS